MNVKGSVLYTAILAAAFVAVLIAFYPQEAASQAGPDIGCRISTGSPGVGESIIFTLQNGTGGTNNAHGARPTGSGAYANRVICNNFTTNSFAQVTQCSDTESGILSFSNYTNAHVEPYGDGTYTWQACGRVENPDTGQNELFCTIRNTCKSFEATLVSLQNGAGGAGNAHLAAPGVYANQLCCSRRCDGASCIVVRTPAPEVFSATGEFAVFDVELFNRHGEESVRVELFLRNEQDYTGTGQFAKYGTWEFFFTNDTGDFYPAQVTVGPKATKLVTFKVKAPPRTPPSTELAPYKFIVRVRDV